MSHPFFLGPLPTSYRNNNSEILLELIIFVVLLPTKN